MDTANGAQVWADRMDGAVEDVFELQDTITEAVVRRIAPAIEGAEIARATAARPDSLTAYDLMLQAMAALNRAEVAQAIPLLDRAIVLAPTYGKALALRAWCATVSTTWEGKSDTDMSAAQGVDLAHRALTLGAADAEVRAYAGYALYFFQSESGLGLSNLRAAVEQCPNFPWALVSLASIEAIDGDLAQAEALCDRAERVNPKDPQAFRLQMTRGLVAFARQDWAALLELARFSLQAMPNVWTMRTYLVIGLAEAGRQAEAKAAGVAFVRDFPEFRLESHSKRIAGLRNLQGGPHDTWKARLLEAGIAW